MKLIRVGHNWFDSRLSMRNDDLRGIRRVHIFVLADYSLDLLVPFRCRVYVCMLFIEN